MKHISQDFHAVWFAEKPLYFLDVGEKNILSEGKKKWTVDSDFVLRNQAFLST